MLTSNINVHYPHSYSIHLGNFHVFRGMSMHRITYRNGHIYHTHADTQIPDVIVFFRTWTREHVLHPRTCCHVTNKSAEISLYSSHPQPRFTSAVFPPLLCTYNISTACFSPLSDITVKHLFYLHLHVQYQREFT